MRKKLNWTKLKHICFYFWAIIIAFSGLTLAKAQDSTLYKNVTFQRNTDKAPTLIFKDTTKIVPIDSSRIKSPSGIDTVIKNPVRTMQVNMIGTANALEAALENGIKERFIDFSTSEVFGSMAFKSAETDQTLSGSAGAGCGIGRRSAGWLRQGWAHPVPGPRRCP